MVLFFIVHTTKATVESWGRVLTFRQLYHSLPILSQKRGKWPEIAHTVRAEPGGIWYALFCSPFWSHHPNIPGQSSSPPQSQIPSLRVGRTVATSQDSSFLYFNNVFLFPLICSWPFFSGLSCLFLISSFFSTASFIPLPSSQNQSILSPTPAPTQETDSTPF